MKRVTTPATSAAIAAAAVLSALSNAALAEQGKPAFDCKAAEHEIEPLICKDAKLAKLDRTLVERFAEAHGNLSDEQKKELDAVQRGWIKGRNDCWNDTDKRGCAEKLHISRIAGLEARYGLTMVGA
jgi:uncharacterized protein